MARYKVIMHYPNGDEELDETFRSEEAAEEAALYACSCYNEGAEVLHMSNPGDYDYDGDEDIEFDIEEI